MKSLYNRIIAFFTKALLISKKEEYLRTKEESELRIAAGALFLVSLVAFFMLVGIVAYSASYATIAAMSMTGMFGVLAFFALAGLIFNLGDNIFDRIVARICADIVDDLRVNRDEYSHQFGGAVYEKASRSAWKYQFSRKTRATHYAEESAYAGAH